MGKFQLELPLLLLVAQFCFLCVHCICSSRFSCVYSATYHYVAEDSYKISPELFPSLKAEQNQFLSLSLYLCKPAPESSYAGGPPLGSFQFANVCLLLEMPKLDMVPHRWSHKCQVEGKRISVFPAAGYSLANTGQYLVSHLHLKSSQLNHHCHMCQS